MKIFIQCISYSYTFPPWSNNKAFFEGVQDKHHTDSSACIVYPLFFFFFRLRALWDNQEQLSDKHMFEWNDNDITHTTQTCNFLSICTLGFLKTDASTRVN